MYRGDYKSGSVIYFKFSTNAAAGTRVDQSSAWETNDIRVYKDDSTTERSSQNGYAITGPFDSMTGITHVTIDTSDNTDAGFFAVGHDYQVVLYPDETIDSQAVSQVIAEFSIENRSSSFAKAMTESYAADGAAPTPAQALFLIQQMLTEFAISGTTLTIKKVDGSTTAAVCTLDSGTTPTSITRTS